MVVSLCFNWLATTNHGLSAKCLPKELHFRHTLVVISSRLIVATVLRLYFMSSALYQLLKCNLLINCCMTGKIMQLDGVSALCGCNVR